MTTETIKQRMTVNPVSGCWEWNGCKRSGYGRTTAGSRTDGTRQDNVDDRERKKRNVVFIGEEHPLAKLTKKSVKDARWERAYKGTSILELAKRYGVSKKTMRNAINGITWKCVPYMPTPPLDTTNQAADL